MKGILLTAMFLYSIFSYAQITIIESKIANEKSKYDSLENYSNDSKTLIGQNFIVIPKAEMLRKYGYQNVYPQKDGRPYITGEGYPYDLLAGKSLKVISFEKYDLTSITKNLLVLFDSTNNKTVYYDYNPLTRKTFPFIIEGYLKKLKGLYVGQKFVSRKKNLDSEKELTNIEGKIIQTSLGETWTISDIVFSAPYYSRMFLLKNKNNEIVSIYPQDIELKHFVFVAPYDIALKIKTKYGNETYLKALRGELKIGASKDLAVLAWGQPRSINKIENKTYVKEQWVYDNNSYLYFTGEKLTTIQN